MTSQTGLVVRRRAGLMALVAVIALALATGYLWRFGQTGGGVPLLIGVLLGLVAVFHGLAWGDARTPLLVADETGLRVRLGGDWTGVPWGHVERVEVDERGRVTDGHVALLVSEAANPLEEAGLRSRLAATMNRWFYDASLVVPYGLTTSVSVVDVPGTLTRLADGRAPVIVLDDTVAEPEPTVEITTNVDSQHAEAPAVDADSDTDTEAGAEVEVEEPPKRQFTPLATIVSALHSHPARREEVTMPVRPEHQTVGMLALSEPYSEENTEPLPEINQLRRGDDDHVDDETGRHGNIGLIIDATTDLSARAMSKVRRPVPTPDPATVEAYRSRATDPDDAEAEDLIIGGAIRVARQRLRLTVDELAERTRIRPFVIESIEVDNFAPCGGDFYARGHLRMLCRVLGVDAAPLLTSYDEHFSASPITPRAVFDAELSTGSKGMVRGGASGANWGGLIAAVLVLLLVWGVAKYFAAGTTPTASDVAPPQNSSGLGSPGAGNKPIPPPAPKEAFVRVSAIGGDSRVVVKDSNKKVVFAGLLADGAKQRVTGVAPLHVMAVDGGVVRLNLKGKNLGLMGAQGEQARHKIAAR